MSAPVPLGDAFAGAMGHATACPNGHCHNTEPPRAAVPTRDGWMTSYLCSDCGTAWTTDYREDV